jgi:hypothetical protein
MFATQLADSRRIKTAAMRVDLQQYGFSTCSNFMTIWKIPLSVASIT